MKKTFSREFYLRTSDFDMNENIKPSAVLDLFQEVASVHAENLGVGFEDLLKKGLLWVLVKVKFEINKAPKMHEKIIVKTWPLPAGRVTLQREYLIEDEEGSVLIKGSSEWVTMNMQTRHLVQNGVSYPLEEFCEDKNFPEKLRKVPDFEIETSGTEIKPSFCDIDENGHVNNTKYADFVLNAYKPKKNEKISLFQLDFQREIKMGDSFLLFFNKNEKGILAKGLSRNGEKMFSCDVTFENA